MKCIRSSKTAAKKKERQDLKEKTNWEAAAERQGREKTREGNGDEFAQVLIYMYENLIMRPIMHN